MDKNTWIGFGLIAVILIGFSIYNRPSEEEMERNRRYQDSIARVQQDAMNREMLALAEKQAVAMPDTTLTDEERMAQLQSVYGAFAPAAQGNDELVSLESKLMRLTFSTRGGMLHSAELLNYKAYGDTVNPLCLFKGSDYELDFTFVPADNKIRHTKDLYFVAQPIVREDGAQKMILRLPSVNEDEYIDFVYTLRDSDYMIDFAIVPHNSKNLLAQNLNKLEMSWHQLIPQQERGRKFEERYAQLQYMFTDGDIDDLSESADDDEKESARLRWIAYKDQFFSTVLIADEAFESTELKSHPLPKNSGYIKEYTTTTDVPFDPSGEAAVSFRMYLGPNHYNVLKAYDADVERSERLHLKELVPLGWNIVSWINKILVIPMFDLFTKWGMGIGWVILLMTIVIKLIIFPFTFKSYQSSAKMRVLKPQIDEINARIPEEKMQERQQATMALYSKAGVSPMSGCLPMLFQMPVVMAMFWFFPTAIELRGQSFLWAEDLSTFDAIISWNANIPVLSYLFNNHISLFTVLFSGVNIAYTYINMQSQNTTGPGSGMMKWMMYLMPVFFFFIFNDYASGLSYYYFISLLITILQTMIFRWTLNDEKVLADMAKAQAKKANKPKSGFMARLEKMQKEQEARMRQQIKEQSKKQYK